MESASALKNSRLIMDELKNAMVVLLDRMADVGWVESSAITPQGLNVVWTESGRAAITILKPLLDVLRLPLSQDEQACLIYLVNKTSVL